MAHGLELVFVRASSGEKRLDTGQSKKFSQFALASVWRFARLDLVSRLLNSEIFM